MKGINLSLWCCLRKIINNECGVMKQSQPEVDYFPVKAFL